MKTRNWPRDIGVALVLFGAFFLLIMSWALWSQSQRLRSFPVQVATIQWVGEMCDMAYKSGKNSYTSAAIISCDEVEAFKLNNADSAWRSTPDQYAELAYVVDENKRQKLVPLARLVDGAQMVGQSTEIHVNPEDPNDIELPFTSRGAMISAIWLALSLIGLISGILLYRRGKRRDS